MIPMSRMYNPTYNQFKLIAMAISVGFDVYTLAEYSSERGGSLQKFISVRDPGASLAQHETWKMIFLGRISRK